ncbi:NADH dehydrogenase subunit N [Propionispira arboris]|uniref:NADH-quinone oxidoreductase subunit N n=1 Tax=Propionispira arboris TaxID=84035 RepID=A0A1H6VG96_9FIRM|nr:NADH-quinone oxidoreductase subunit N [Propionispira arboris]SEJ02004.1 NADH dehydrogenase subunit N [Propionispira arboris]
MNIALLTSEIAVVILALLIIIFDLLLPRQETRRSLGAFAVCGLLGILVYTFSQYGISATVYHGFFVVDTFALFFKQLFIVATILTLLFSLDYVEKMTRNAGEFYALLLLGLVGMMVMASATDLLTLFVGLELMTIVFYVLVGFDLKSVKSSEAGIKYAILGSASSAVFLYGVSWIYGFTGNIMLSQIAEHITASPAVLFGMGLMIAGFCFKLSIVPFHMWAPDVYEGAPIPVTAMLAMASKAAGFAIVLRVFFVAFNDLQMYWLPIVSALAGLSMVVGIVGAIWQKNTKRMLAYSSIAQAGYILSGMLAANPAGVKGMLVYAVLYMVANVGAFAVTLAVYNQCGSDDIEDLSGLSQKSPLLAVVMTVSLMSMAGLPPMAGFVGKMYIFMAIADSGYLWLAILGLVMSMISVYYYILVVRAMYSNAVKDQQIFTMSGSLRIVALLSLIATLFIGIYPAPLATLANAAAMALW